MNKQQAQGQYEFLLAWLSADDMDTGNDIGTDEERVQSIKGVDEYLREHGVSIYRAIGWTIVEHRDDKGELVKTRHFDTIEAYRSAWRIAKEIQVNYYWGELIEYNDKEESHNVLIKARSLEEAGTVLRETAEQWYWDGGDDELLGHYVEDEDHWEYEGGRIIVEVRSVKEIPEEDGIVLENYHYPVGRR